MPELSDFRSIFIKEELEEALKEALETFTFC